MKPIKITTIPIHPATNVRSTKNEGWLLADNVTYEYLKGLDEKRLVEHGKRGTLASRKKQLEITRAHKDEIKAWVVRNNFKMPHGNVALWFYVPMPRTWRAKTIREKCYTVHLNTPDLDNYIKQLYDSIMPRKNRQRQEKGIDDRKIFSYAAFKVWVPFEEACMKVVEYDPDEFARVFQHGHPTYQPELAFMENTIYPNTETFRAEMERLKTMKQSLNQNL
jgi:Holliday junction resolvase RusA-like endonuclease